MSTSIGLPTPAASVITSPLGDELVVFNPADAMIHVLSATAALVWEACAGGAAAGELADALAGAAGVDAGHVAKAVDRCLGQLVSAGLVGDHQATVEEADLVVPAELPADGACTSRPLRVIDDTVLVRCADPAVIRAVERTLISLPASVSLDHDPVIVSIETDDAGYWHLWAPGIDEWRSNRDTILDLVPSALNLVAAASRGCLALHAGAVRHPCGTVVVLPGESGSGKSTLTAALVRAGWDYVTDEAVGVRAGTLATVAYPKPLALAGDSRAVVGLSVAPGEHTMVGELRTGAVVTEPVGSVALVVLPSYRPGQEPDLELLTPTEAVPAIAEHALNLRRGGGEALDALAGLAGDVPVFRLRHAGADQAVRALEALAR